MMIRLRNSSSEPQLQNHLNLIATIQDNNCMRDISAALLE